MIKRNTLGGHLGFTKRLGALTLGVLCMGSAFAAQTSHGYPGTRTYVTHYPYAVLLKRLQHSIKAHHMGLLSIASASHGAALRGITIPGNAVLMVFRNDFAVRMLKDSVAAGMEAPLRIYVTAQGPRRADITYRTPSAVFSPYHNAPLNALAHQLDPIYAAIVKSAAGPGARRTREP